jgi:hypothetical protein
MRGFLNLIAQLNFSLGSIGCIEDVSDICRHFPFYDLTWHVLASVLLQVKLTVLPGNAPEAP